MRCGNLGCRFISHAGKYYCPIHPEEVSDKPGICSKCGMDPEKAADPEK
jgi:hypothetical protein